MPLLLTCTRLDTCQADSHCTHPSCFQAWLEGYGYQQRRIRKDAESCASHLGRIVQMLSTWAAEHHLADGRVTVLAIDPRPSVVTHSALGLLIGTIPVKTGSRSGPQST
jgi:hypothetical protein